MSWGLTAAAALLGAPLFVVMFVVTALLYASDPTLSLTNVFLMMSVLMQEAHLLPIALFTIAGFLLADSGTPHRLVRVAEAWFGWLPGGLAIVAVLTLAFFTTFTGASGVTIIALGGLLWPLLSERGYPEQFSLGVLTASGAIGLLFFPSLPVFLYVTVASTSAPGAGVNPWGLFAAGLLPGVLLVTLLVAYSMWSGRRHRVARRPFSLREAVAATREASFEVLLPVFLVVAYLVGWAGLEELPVLMALYSLLLVTVVRRDLHPTRDLPRVITNGAALVGAIFIILAVIIGLNNYLMDHEVPNAILGFIQEHIDSRWAMLLALNVFLLVVGALMDIFSALVAVLPFIIPLAEAYQIDPLHLGVIFLANLEVGYLTPPVGMNLFISGLHFKRPLLSVARSVVPFMTLLLLGLALITYVPALSTALPEALGVGATPSRAAPASDGGEVIGVEPAPGAQQGGPAAAPGAGERPPAAGEGGGGDELMNEFDDDDFDEDPTDYDSLEGGEAPP